MTEFNLGDRPTEGRRLNLLDAALRLAGFVPYRDKLNKTVWQTNGRLWSAEWDARRDGCEIFLVNRSAAYLSRRIARLMSLRPGVQAVDLSLPAIEIAFRSEDADQAAGQVVTCCRAAETTASRLT